MFNTVDSSLKPSTALPLNPFIADADAPKVRAIRLIPSDLASPKESPSVPYTPNDLSLHSLALFFVGNIGASLDDASNHFSVTATTVGRLLSADSYQEFAHRLALDLDKPYTDPSLHVKTKATAATGFAVSVLMERLTDKDLSNSELLKITDTLAGVAGLKEKAVAVQINNSFSASGDQLRNARTFTQPLGAAC